MKKSIQAKHLDERPFLEAAQASQYGVIWWDFAEQRLPDVPHKVVLAKWRALYERDLLEGCPCGCRGDFKLTDKGRAALEALRAARP